MTLILPIKELKNSVKISEICHSSDEPVFITKNGYGDMVIMSIETYEKMEKRLRMYRELELSEDDVRSGNVMDADAALKNLKKKYDL